MPTLILRPNSDSLKTNWTGIGDTTNLYANVDESTLNTDDWNATTTSAIAILFGFPDHTTESGTISKVTFKSYIAGRGTNTMKLCTKIGSTTYYGSQFTTSSDGTNNLYTWETTVRPSDSNAWSWDDIDAMLSGCYGVSISSGKGEGVLNYMTWVEVEYTEAAGGKFLVTM